MLNNDKIIGNISDLTKHEILKGTIKEKDTTREINICAAN